MFSVISKDQLTRFLESSVKLTEFGTANNTTEASLNNNLGLFTMFLLAAKHCTNSTDYFRFDACFDPWFGRFKQKYSF